MLSGQYLTAFCGCFAKLWAWKVKNCSIRGTKESMWERYKGVAAPSICVLALPSAESSDQWQPWSTKEKKINNILLIPPWSYFSQQHLYPSPVHKAWGIYMAFCKWEGEQAVTVWLGRTPRGTRWPSALWYQRQMWSTPAHANQTRQSWGAEESKNAFEKHVSLLGAGGSCCVRIPREPQPVMAETPAVFASVSVSWAGLA